VRKLSTEPAVSSKKRAGRPCEIKRRVGPSPSSSSSAAAAAPTADDKDDLQASVVADTPPAVGPRPSPAASLVRPRFPFLVLLARPLARPSVRCRGDSGRASPASLSRPVP
jgi:hypothetical protein